MNKRYIDFVPAKAKESTRTTSRKKVSPEALIKRGTSIEKKPEVREDRVGSGITPAIRRTGIREDSRKVPEVRRTGVGINNRKTPELGVIEDLNNDYQETRISRSHFVEEKSSIRAVKAEKVGLKKEDGRVKDKNSVIAEKKEVKKTDYKLPKTPFINQDKVVKRPLSKNVYRKKIEVPKEEPKGPVTIITKPEKQAHVSLIVTIILTIILGAAAGTVAFLLLPK